MPLRDFYPVGAARLSAPGRAVHRKDLRLPLLEHPRIALEAQGKA